MKGVIPTPDIAKIFHPTPDIEGKKDRHPTFKIYPDTRHPTSKRRNSGEEIRHITFTLLF